MKGDIKNDPVTGQIKFKAHICYFCLNQAEFYPRDNNLSDNIIVSTKVWFCCDSCQKEWKELYE